MSLFRLFSVYSTTRELFMSWGCVDFGSFTRRQWTFLGISYHNRLWCRHSEFCGLLPWFVKLIYKNKTMNCKMHLQWILDWNGKEWFLRGNAEIEAFTEYCMCTVILSTLILHCLFVITGWFRVNLYHWLGESTVEIGREGMRSRNIWWIVLAVLWQWGGPMRCWAFS